MSRALRTLVIAAVLISFFAAGLGNVALAKDKKTIEINFTWANPQYPEFAEAFGLNMYLAALDGLTRQHPALKGKVKMKIYDKGMLYGSQDEALTALASGAVQMTYSGPHFLEQLAPEWRLGEAPGMFRSWEHFMRTMNTPEWKALQEKMAKEQGVTIVKWLFNVGDWYIFTHKGPVKTLEDLKGQKIRYPGGEAFAKTLKALGATGVALPYTEVVTGLQTNMIEGVLTDFTGGPGFYFLDRYCEHAIHLPLAVQPVCWVVNTKWWESLRPEIRDALVLPFERIDMDSYYTKLEKGEMEKWTNNPRLHMDAIPSGEAEKWYDAIKEATKGMFSDIDPKYMKAIDSSI